MKKFKICFKVFLRLLLSIFLYPFITIMGMILASNPTWVAVAGIMFLVPVLCFKYFIGNNINLITPFNFTWSGVLYLYFYISPKIIKKIERKTDAII